MTQCRRFLTQHRLPRWYYSVQRKFEHPLLPTLWVVKVSRRRLILFPSLSLSRWLLFISLSASQPDLGIVVKKKKKPALGTACWHQLGLVPAAATERGGKSGQARRLPGCFSSSVATGHQCLNSARGGSSTRGVAKPLRETWNG
jgi:hypothetical protein